jgi:prepilin-type processing-associated H-X9-DG protein
MPDFVDTPANQAAGNISYYYYSFDRVLNTVTPPSPSYSTWICWGFLPGRGVRGPRVMTEAWDSSCWLFTDGWSKLTRDNHGITLHESHNGSINVCYLDGHVKFQGGPAQAVFR